MNINFIEINNTKIAELISEKILIHETQDALDLMAECSYQGGANQIILYEHNLVPDFFKLSSGIAGEILQKFSNYRTRLAIVGDFSKYPGKSLRDFIFESNKTGHIVFVNDLNDAIDRLIIKSF